MKKFFITPIGQLRLCAFLEGISLLVLVFIAVPLKYGFDRPSLVSTLGPIHGALFMLFVFSAVRVGVEMRWKFRETTWKVLIACLIPFGTLYLDYVLLRKLQA
jgi:integral membrane protein